MSARDGSIASTLAGLKTGQYAKLDTQLAALLATADAPAVRTLAVGGDAGVGMDEGGAALLATVRNYANAVTTLADGQRYVVIDATARDGDGAALLASLDALGLRQGSSFGSLASGLIPLSQLGALSHLDNLSVAHQSAMGAGAGLVTSQTDVAQQADVARATYGVDGTGLKIGVLSDSFDTSGSLGIDGKPDTLASNIASGDLPQQTKVLEDYAGGTDEGRGMAQLIHDVAPGAAIDFATAFTGQAGFANNILKLAADGSRVIVDDIIYYFEPAYQDGVIAQAVNQVAAQGVSYFSSAGNNGFEGYESRWYDGGFDARFDGRLMEFAPGQNALSFKASGYEDVFVLQWDQPAASAGGAGSASDLDLFVTDASGNTVYTLSASNNLGGDPSEGVSFQGVAGQTYYLRVSLYDGPTPGALKVMALGNGSGVDLETTARNINTGTTYGHAAATGANAVAAAYYLETPAYGTDPALLEPYSSGGPVRIAFDAQGNRLDQVEVRNTPAFTSTDGTNTTFFGSDTRGDADSFPNFFGTSAAAPNAAAIALLTLQANPSLTNADVAALMRSASLDMDNPATPGFDVGPDAGSGTGLVLANLAVRYAATGIIDNAAAPNLYGTHLADTIIGGAGDNVIAAGAGNDRITGGAGNDRIDGGDGTDTLVLSGARSAYTFTGTGSGLDGSVTDARAGGDGTDTFRNVERVAFGDGTSATLAALLNAGQVNGVTTAPDARGVINGTAGSDHISGTSGNDHIAGGAGVDYLYGGAGNDSFVLKLRDFDPAVTTQDVIYDFGGAGGYSASNNDFLALTGFGQGARLTFDHYGTDATSQYYTIAPATGTETYQILVKSLDGKLLTATDYAFYG